MRENSPFDPHFRFNLVRTRVRPEKVEGPEFSLSPCSSVPSTGDLGTVCPLPCTTPFGAINLRSLKSYTLTFSFCFGTTLPSGWARSSGLGSLLVKQTRFSYGPFMTQVRIRRRTTSVGFPSSPPCCRFNLRPRQWRLKFRGH